MKKYAGKTWKTNCIIMTKRQALSSIIPSRKCDSYAYAAIGLTLKRVFLLLLLLQLFFKTYKE